MDQDDEVVSLCSTAGIISHDVVVKADQGPVDGAKGEGQQFGGVLWGDRPPVGPVATFRGSNLVGLTTCAP